MCYDNISETYHSAIFIIIIFIIKISGLEKGRGECVIIRTQRLQVRV